MPFQFFNRTTLPIVGKQKSAAYDLQARANNLDGIGVDANLEQVDLSGNDNSQVQGISIAQHEHLSYIPDMTTTKSLATDVIQLTRFKNRRPTVQDYRPERKPSIRNIFLGVPEPERRRFSQDIRSCNLVAKCAALENSETKRVLILQVFIPFLLSGFGNVGAGLFLNHAQKWTVFREETIFYMLLATIMAFKTNLEATYAARLSTCSNLGSFKTWQKKLEAFIGNLALVQTQSIIFGLMASCLVLGFDALQAGHFLPTNLCLRLLATSMAAISLNEILSSILIMAVVELSEKAGVNPDNVSTLIAAMFGDFSSVLFVSIGASYFHAMNPDLQWIFITIIVGLLSLLPFTIYISNINPFTRGMFLATHIPLTLAVVVATLSGLVFEHAVQSFARIAIYQAVVNGVSVNLMAVQASRISTYLQQLNSIAPDRARQYANKCSPFEALFAQDMNASVARWLIALCIPAMSTYLCFIFLVAPSSVDVTLCLIACSLLAICLQVTIIQCLTYLVTPISWKLDLDPDNVVIPVLMSISDCSGNAILLMAFVFLRYMNDANSVGHNTISNHNHLAITVTS